MTKINLGSFKVDALNQDEVISEIKRNLLKSVAPQILVSFFLSQKSLHLGLMHQL